MVELVTVWGKVVMVGLMVLMGVTALYMPVHQDEAVFLTVGKRMALGELPYRDLFDHKPPGIYIVSKWLYATLGAWLMPVRGLMLAVNLTAALLWWKLMERVLGKSAYAWLGGAAFWMMTIWYQGNFMMTESWANWLIVAGLWVYVLRKDLVWLTGAALAGAIWFKLTAGLVAVVIFGYLIKDKEVNKAKLWGGFGAVMGMFGAWTICMGVGAQMWESVVIYNLRDYPAFPWQATLRELVPLAAPLAYWWISGAIGLITGLKKKPHLKLFAWMGMASLPMILFRPYHHYWLPLVPVVVIGAVYLQMKLKAPPLLAWLSLMVVGIYYVFVLGPEMKPKLDEQMAMVERGDCGNQDEVAVYYFGDCVPEKYFYRPGSWEP